MNSILIVDDDIQLRNSFKKLLIREGYAIRTAPDGETGLSEVKKDIPDLVIMDVRMPGMSGLETFKAMREIAPKLTVIIVTAYGTTDTAIEATKLGAFDYIRKPFNIPNTLSLIEKALEAGRLMKSRVEIDVDPETASRDAIIGNSEPMQEVYKEIGRAAPTDATVLVRGESGTGKELIARALYQHSQRNDKPFIIVNCVAIPETLLESELFGYEKGAFTGAASQRVGKIEQANGGTIFLDEIGDMPLSIQAKILRLLEEKSIERLGGYNPIPVDARIIAATNRDLEKAISDGAFREDLYYRLKVVTIELPPLRRRQDDVHLLCDYYMTRFSAEIDMDNPGISDDAKKLMQNYPWPGNVRELANAIKKATIFSRGYPIRPEDIQHAISGIANQVEEDSLTFNDSIRQWVREALVNGQEKEIFNYLMDSLGRIIIIEALNFSGFNRTHAAKMLGITRPTLQARIEKYGISIEPTVKNDNHN